jgi:glutaredoxin
LPVLTLYSRPDCHLCEQAHAILVALQPAFGYELRTVDIDRDPDLVAHYGVTIPVASLDGEELLVWPFTRAAAHAVLRDRLRETR